MARKIDWESQIGRRLKLRDLHVFSIVVQRGSMTQAAAQFGVSQAAVSELMSNLEHTLGVQLLDRSPRGVEPTMYGRALLKGGAAAFDDLKQSIREIEFLADPSAGEVRIGCPESSAATLLPPIIQQFYLQYPRVVLHVQRLPTPTLELPELRARRLDVVLTRFMRPIANEDDDLNVDILFDDELVVAAGLHNRWASRRRIDLAELVNEPWILTPPDSWNYLSLEEAFRECGLDMPKIILMTFCVPLRANLLATGPFLTAFPRSALQLGANQFALKVLPIDLPIRPWPLAIVTLKNRTSSPIVQLFIDHVRAFTNSVAAGLKPEKKPASEKISAATDTSSKLPSPLPATVGRGRRRVGAYDKG